jgi:hypothetical protein
MKVNIKIVKSNKLLHNKLNIEDLNKLLIKLNDGYASVLPGISDYTFLKLDSEIQTNLSQWKSVKNFTSWLGLAFGQNKSRKMNKRSKKNQQQKQGKFSNKAHKLY